MDRGYSLRRSWAAGANLVIAVAYLGITFAILRPLFATDQWRSNRLETATAAIFFTCAVHHGAHAVHMLLPALRIDDPAGLALRQAFHWPVVMWDFVGAGVADRCVHLRRSHPRTSATRRKRAVRPGWVRTGSVVGEGSWRSALGALSLFLSHLA